jgi:hypothetical protein
LLRRREKKRLWAERIDWRLFVQWHTQKWKNARRRRNWK